MPSYNNVIDLFKAISTNHQQIKEFGSGNLSEIEGNTHLFPLVWATPVDANTRGIDNGSTALIYRFRLLCMDLVQKDRSNEQEVLSDTLRILLDFVAKFKKDYDDYTIEGEVKFTPFIERFGDDVSGWMAEIFIKVSEGLDDCAVPTN